MSALEDEEARVLRRIHGQSADTDVAGGQPRKKAKRLGQLCVAQTDLSRWPSPTVLHPPPRCTRPVRALYPKQTGLYFCALR